MEEIMSLISEQIIPITCSTVIRMQDYKLIIGSFSIIQILLVSFSNLWILKLVAFDLTKFTGSLSMISNISHCSKSSIITIGIINSRIAERFTTSTEGRLILFFKEYPFFLGNS